MIGSPQSYKYTECGLSSVEILNVTVYSCAACGTKVPEMPAIEQLHLIIAIELLTKDSLLSGEEIRFLRKMAGLTQVELAAILKITPTRPSKWEKGIEPIGDANDLVLRSFLLFGIQQRFWTGEDPACKMREASDILRQMDIRELFKSIKGKASGSKSVKVESSGITPEPWKVPTGRDGGCRVQ
jgi:DNA-binding transcriptional regulator YiaG